MEGKLPPVDPTLKKYKKIAYGCMAAAFLSMLVMEHWYGLYAATVLVTVAFGAIGYAWFKDPRSLGSDADNWGTIRLTYHNEKDNVRRHCER